MGKKDIASVTTCFIFFTILQTCLAMQENPVVLRFVEGLRVTTAKYFDAIADGNLEMLRSQYLSKRSLQILILTCSSLSDRKLRESLGNDPNACIKHVLYLGAPDIISKAREKSKNCGAASIQVGNDGQHAILRLPNETIRLVYEDAIWKVDLRIELSKRIIALSLTPQGRKEIEALLK